MFSRILSLISILFVITACSHTGSKSGSAANGGSPEDRYRIESENLNAFDPIKGSKVNARAHDRVFFEYNKSVLSPAGQSTLDKQAAWLKKNDKVSVTVEGHADERGTREYNLALGERRAAAAKSYLVTAGVSAKRIKTISYGKERPAVVGSNESSWAENRRAVTVLNN
jgi:peptidoglycan-associated lipoprotein